MDGSLGSVTALMFEPYSNSAEGAKNYGLQIHNDSEYFEWVSGADRSDLQVSIHAIGDQAVHKLLGIFERAGKENDAKFKRKQPKDRRFRIEHSQHITEMDIHSYQQNNIIASVQPYHLMDDGVWAEKLLGKDRLKRMYVFKSLLESGVHLAAGSDWFVAPPSVIEGIRGFVTRQTLDGKHPDGFVVNEKITVEQALTAYTSGAAYASFDEDKKGILAVGMLADFVLLSQDLFEIKPNEIVQTKVLSTVVNGKVVFDL